MADSPERDILFSAKEVDIRSLQNGHNYVLAIGIDTYKDHAIPNLNNAKRDAMKFREVLFRRYSFEEDHIKILLNEEATRENIIGELDSLSDQIAPEDNLLFYFSGHGYFRKKGNSGIGYLVPSDAETGEYSSLLPNSTLLDYLSLIDAKHVLLIVDSCYSGSLITKLRDVPSFDKHREGISTYAQRVGKLRSRMGLAAGRIEKVADGGIGAHSPFTTSLLGILESNTHTNLPSSELFQKVKTHTTIKADQTPVSGVLAKSLHEGGEYIFHLRPDESQDWEKARITNSVKSFEQYLQLHPQGKHIEKAWWALATLKDNQDGYRTYMRKFPKGTYYKEAVRGLAQVKEREVFEQAMRKGEEALLAFLHDHPTSQYVQKAKEEIDQILAREQEPQIWELAQGGDLKEVQAYLDQFPYGKNAANARKRLKTLRQQHQEEEDAKRKRKETETKDRQRNRYQKEVKKEPKHPRTSKQVTVHGLMKNPADQVLPQTNSPSVAKPEKTLSKAPKWFLAACIVLGIPGVIGVIVFLTSLIYFIGESGQVSGINQFLVVGGLISGFVLLSSIPGVIFLYKRKEQAFAAYGVNLILLALGAFILIGIIVVNTSGGISGKAPLIIIILAFVGIFGVVPFLFARKARAENWIG